MVKNIVIFASGTGSVIFVSIYNHIDKKGDINARIALLINNNPSAELSNLPNLNNIPTSIINNDLFNDRGIEVSGFLLEEILKVKADLIVLAGYLKIIQEEVIAKYENKILNIHPSLLPKFGGKECMEKKFIRQ